MSHNLSRMSKPQFRILSEEQIEEIHQASVNVLQRTGYHVPLAEARDILQLAGARIDGERVYIPEKLVHQALSSLQPITLFDRCGQAVLPLNEGRVTFGAIADTPFVMDPYQHKVRPFVKSDQCWFTTLLDALPNIEWIVCVGQAEDVPETLQTQIAFSQSVCITSKPIFVLPYDRRGLLDILELISLIKGSEASFRDRPFLFCGSVPITPLAGTDYNLEVLLTCAEREVPVLYYSCSAIGGNSPASMIGTLILANADWLCGLVIHQLKRPGAPFCSAGFVTMLMDMRTTDWSYTAPEALLMSAAVADIAHWYGMPAWGMEMVNDGPRLDAQAGATMQAMCNWGMLSGVELIHGIGMTRYLSPEAVVLADEIIAYNRAMVKPIDIADENIKEIINVICDIGPKGDYLGHHHTLNHFKDFWYPSLFDRRRYDPQITEQGPGLVDRLNIKVRSLIETHKPTPLDKDIQKEINKLTTSWYIRDGYT